MWTARFFALALMFAFGTGDTIYKGPVRLRTFDVVHPVQIKKLLGQLGEPASHKSPFCYRYDKAAYLRISAIHEQRESVGELLISSIPTCPPNAIAKAGLDFRSWKTPEGIGLGSSKRDVLRSYGNPTSIKKPDQELSMRFFSEYASKLGNGM